MELQESVVQEPTPEMWLDSGDCVECGNAAHPYCPVRLCGDCWDDMMVEYQTSISRDFFGIARQRDFFGNEYF